MTKVTRQPSRFLHISHCSIFIPNNVAAHRTAEEKVQKSEQAGTSTQEPGDARKIDQFPEDVSTIVVHHSSILRNKRLLLAYRSDVPSHVQLLMYSKWQIHSHSKWHKHSCLTTDTV